MHVRPPRVDTPSRPNFLSSSAYSPRYPAHFSCKFSCAASERLVIANLLPLAFRPSFPPLLNAASAAILTGLLLRLARRRWSDPQRRARAAQARDFRHLLAQADSLAQRGDVPGFFQAGRRALQTRLAEIWQRPGQALALADLTGQLPPDSPVIAFFREADLQEFSPPTPRVHSPLPQGQALLQQALHSLTASSAP